jgi:hypothetical protein
VGDPRCGDGTLCKRPSARCFMSHWWRAGPSSLGRGIAPPDLLTAQHPVEQMT